MILMKDSSTVGVCWSLAPRGIQISWRELTGGAISSRSAWQVGGRRAPQVPGHQAVGRNQESIPNWLGHNQTWWASATQLKLRGPAMV